MPHPPWVLNRAEQARMNRLIQQQENGCWVWQGDQTSNGYGKWQRGPGYSQRVIHRIAYEHYKNEKIAEGMQLDHLCRNRLCLNPEHMEVVTPSENTLRQDHWERRKTACPKGHEYNDENTRVSNAGKRVCRVCDRERKRT